MDTKHTPSPAGSQLAQLAATFYWGVATSEDNAIARWDSETYKLAQRAFMSTVREVYGISRTQARKVLSLLSEYGPTDSLSGSPGWGIDNYVHFALTNTRSQYGYL